MSGSFGRRLAALEATMIPASDHCRSCGLRHVQPLTMDLARRIVGPVSTMAPKLRSTLDGQAPRLCLCDPCCGDPGDRRMARLSHGYDGPFDAA